MGRAAAAGGGATVPGLRQSAARRARGARMTRNRTTRGLGVTGHRDLVPRRGHAAAAAGGRAAAAALGKRGALTLPAPQPLRHFKLGKLEVPLHPPSAPPPSSLRLMGRARSPARSRLTKKFAKSQTGEAMEPVGLSIRYSSQLLPRAAESAPPGCRIGVGARCHPSLSPNISTTVTCGHCVTQSFLYSSLLAPNGTGTGFPVSE
jgi:hypothetical protein